MKGGAAKQTIRFYYAIVYEPVVHCSDADAGLSVTVRPALNLMQAGGSASMRRVTSNFASVPRGSTGPGSIAADSFAGQGGLLAGARSGGSAKSQISGNSSASALKSRASMATCASVGSALAKDKLAQVRHG